jgi:hypothetical protein
MGIGLLEFAIQLRHGFELPLPLEPLSLMEQIHLRLDHFPPSKKELTPSPQAQPHPKFS